MDYAIFYALQGESGMNYDFSGKVALITGAGGGIGRATAIAFGKSGASVVVSDVSVQGGEETVALVEQAGGKAIFVACDVADADAVNNMVAQAIQVYGRLDYGHNNAGITNIRSSEWDEDVWDRTLSINLTGVMHCMRAEVDAMLLSASHDIPPVSAPSPTTQTTVLSRSPLIKFPRATPSDQESAVDACEFSTTSCSLSARFG